jgi:hypothetical protein
MIRIVVENIFFFMLPTFFYIAWVAFKEDEWSGLSDVIRKAPLLRLFAAGAALMLATLVVLSSRSYNDPSDVYVPPSMEDGKIDPARSIREPKPQPGKP